jgi:hypothetical protein
MHSQKKDAANLFLPRRISKGFSNGCHVRSVTYRYILSVISICQRETHGSSDKSENTVCTKRLLIKVEHAVACFDDTIAIASLSISQSLLFPASTRAAGMSFQKRRRIMRSGVGSQ